MKYKILRSLKQKIFTILFLATVILFAVIFAVTAADCVRTFARDASRIAETRTREGSELFSELADGYVLRTQQVAAELQGRAYDTEEEYDELLSTLGRDAEEMGFLSLSVFDGRGEHHTMATQYYGDSTEVNVLLARTTGRPVVSVYRSNSAGRFCTAIYVAVPESEEGTIDCVCGIFLAETVFRTAQTDEFFDGSDAFIVGAEGYYYDYDGSDAAGMAETFEDYLSDFASRETASALSGLIASRDFGSVTFSSGGTDYVCAFSRLGNGSSAYLAVVYDRDALLNEDGGLFTGFLVSVSILAVLLVLALVLDLIQKRRVHRERMQAEEIDPLLKCSTYARFKKDAERLILDNRADHYAVICFEIENFKYVQEHFGEDIAEDAKKFAAGVFSSVLGKNETFGHLTGDRFVLLLRYEIKPEISSRITLIGELINHYAAFRKSNFFCLFGVGVYYVLPAENVDVDAFLNRAHIAQLAHKKSSAAAFVAYNADLYENYRIEAEIESRMEGALKNCDFHLFYQPKYSIAGDRLEGAETLVRWYDAERNGYVPPGKFVPLFEINGFINKLDRYVFVHACEFFANAVRNGLRVTPLSVNVSRVTAIQKDFVSFYVSNKAKYNIPDGYITIEFTESFSFNNLDVLSNIVTELKKNGFRCSIDDFGSGYSSCGVLKELPVDELKLDMFLLKPSAHPQKDEALLESMIRLGKAFDMKVTQEGVETMEQFEMLKRMGCDVIQGYLYSKPLLADDFQAFVQSPTDLQSVLKRDSDAFYKKPEYIDFSVH